MKKLIPVLVLALLFVAGCYPGASISLPGLSPVINSFNASPASISAGESATLSWTISGAATASIDQGIGSVALTGSRVVSPTATTVYTLTASGSGGSVTATTQVVVTGVTPIPAPVPTGYPVINSFVANPPIISLGYSSTLSWNVTNATSVSINQGVGPVSSSGSTLVSPPTTLTYMLTATNANGSITSTALVQVSGTPPIPVGPPIVDYFTASPPTISSGGSTFLRWSVSNATSVSIDNGIGPVDSHGTLLVSPPYSTVYTLTALNSYGYQYQTVSVEVAGFPPPTTFYVTSVIASASPPSFSGPCPYQFNFSATITTNGPGTVTYQWERSDGTADPPQSISLVSAGSVVVTTYWVLGGTGGWERVRILSPNSVVSNEAFFVLNCF